MVEETILLDAEGECGQFFYFVQAKNTTICNFSTGKSLASNYLETSGMPTSKSEEGQALRMIKRGFKKYLILLLILAEVAPSFAWFATLKRYARRQFTTAKLVLKNLDYIQENALKTTTPKCITSEKTSSHH